MPIKKPVTSTAYDRREPTQARAIATIKAIFQATAQIVEREGLQALSTNKIAERAGVSVGTLYQYFSTKEAVLLAMTERERRRQLDLLNTLMAQAEAQHADPQALIAQFMHALVQGFGGNADTGPQAPPHQAARNAMIRVGWQIDDPEAVTQALRETSDRVALHLARIARQPGAPQLRTSPAALYVTTRAIIGTIRSASLERSALLGSPEFEAELQRLAWAMLVEG